MTNRTWVRDTYTVSEVDFDHDLKQFEVLRDDEILATITPADLEAQESIVQDLENGECVDGWEDGMGNIVSID